MKKRAFESNVLTETAKPIGFNLITESNGFNSIFNVKPLDLADANKIEKMLVECYQPGLLAEEQVEQDAKTLQKLCAEIKAIGKQGTLLMGQRVSAAKDILKPYRDGTFSQWLQVTFGTRKSGYNVLAYYELYTALPQQDLKEAFKKLPHTAAYLLASRVGDIETKQEIIREYHDLSHNDLSILIQERLPVAITDKRAGKSSIDRIISTLVESLEKLLLRKQHLSERNKADLLSAEALFKEIRG